MKKIELKNDQKTIRLNEISIEDFRAHRILSSTADSDKEQKLSNAISIGFLCLERTASITEVDWVSQRLQEHIMLLNYRLEEKSNEVIDLVKRNFDGERSNSLVAPFAITIEQARKDLSDKLKESIEVLREQERGLKEALSATFDSNNRTSQVHRFHEQLAVAVEGLDKRFDPSVEGSLLSTFLSRFSDLSAQAATAPAVQQKIDALRDEVKEMVTHLTTKFSEQRAFDVEKADLINNTPAKGVVFEELVFNQLTEIASVRNDIVEDVGAQTGRGTSKKGDITYDSTESQVRLVYELKDQTSTFTFQKIKDLMCESIENRNAHYGVFLVKDKECLPDGIGNFHISDDFCVATYDGLFIATKISLLMAIYKKRRSSRKEGPDLPFIETKILEIKETMGGIQQLENHCLSAQRAIDKTLIGLEKLCSQATQNIDEIWEQLQKTNGDGHE